MIVSELIEALQKMPQGAKVNVHGGYDQHYGNFYNYVRVATGTCRLG